MSSLPPFMTGLLLSGVGYVYLSRQIVAPRNRLMLEHFPSDGLEPYRPERPNVSLQSLWPGSASSTDAPAEKAAPPTTSPEGVHPLIVEARNKWNSAVHSGANAVVKALFGTREKSAGAKGEDNSVESSSSSASSS